MPRSNLEILAYDATSLGLLCLRRRELLSRPGTVVTEVTLDHEFLMSSYNTQSERALAERGLELHRGSHLRVLVGGLGLGYTAHAALSSSRVARVTAIEFLPQVIAWVEEGLVPLSSELRGDPRFQTQVGDVYERLSTEPTELFDLILIDVDHSPEDRLSESSAFFYTDAGLRLASRHSAPGGVLGIWSHAPSSTFQRALQKVFPSVHAAPVTFFNDLIGEERTDWMYFGQRSH